jgi:tetratricopeptide (TPR) repeat protein
MTNSDNSPVQARAARRFSFDSASIWVLVVSIALAGVAFIPSTTIPFLYTKIAILAIGGLIAVAFYILARLTRGNIIVPPVPLLGALWIVPLAYALSSLFSGAGFGTSFFGTELEPDTFGFMLLLALLATLTALVFRRTNQYRVFFAVSACVLGFILAAQIVFLILGHIMPNTVGATANLVGSFMDLGMLTGLGVSLALLTQRFLTLTGWKQIALWVGGGVGLVMLALVNAGLVWILVALVSLGLFIEAILRRRVSVDDSDLDGVETLSAEHDSHMPASDHSESGSLAAPLVVLVIALFFIIGGSTIGSALTTAFGTNVLDVRPSWQSTFNVGSHTYASSPIFGSGPNTFSQQWLKFRDRSLNNTVFWNVNFTSGIGLIPTSFVTEGLLGALAWIGFIGLFLFFGLRALLFRTPVDPFARFVSITSFVGTLYVLGLMIFATPGPVVLVVGFVMAGLFVSSLRYAGMRQEWGIVFAKNPRVGFVIVFGLTLLLLASVVAAYVVVERYLADHAYAQASVSASAGNLTAADAAINQAILFAPSDRAYQLAAAIGIAHMNQIASNTKLTPAQAQQQFQAALSGSVQAAQAATKLGTNNYQNWVVLGTVYQTVVPLNIDGAYQNAKAAYQHAILLNPTDPTLPYTMAQLDIAHKDGPAAEADLIQAISLKSDYTQAIFLFSQLEAQQGKAKEALQAAEAAAYFAPNDPTVLFQVGILRSANGDTNGAVVALSQAVQLNPQYANAHFFLAVMYATLNQYPQAIAQLQAVAGLSPANAQAVAADISQLQTGKNPFPASQLGALGQQSPVTDTSGAAKAPTATSTTGK